MLELLGAVGIWFFISIMMLMCGVIEDLEYKNGRHYAWDVFFWWPLLMIKSMLKSLYNVLFTGWKE